MIFHHGGGANVSSNLCLGVLHVLRNARGFGEKGGVKTGISYGCANATYDCDRSEPAWESVLTRQ